MTAGTVVITGGLIAAVILLTIVTVLCYCRLQVKKNSLRPLLILSRTIQNYPPAYTKVTWATSKIN